MRLLPLTALLTIACAAQKGPRSPSPLTVSFKNPALELCEGMQGHLIVMTSWAYTTEPPPEGPPVIAWRTLAPSIAEVSSEGEVTAIGPGRALIEAEALLGGRRGSARAEVNVRAGTLDTAASQETEHLVCRAPHN